MEKELKLNQRLIYSGLYLLIVYTLTNTLGEVLIINYGSIIKLLITIIIGTLVQLIVAFPLSLYLISILGLSAFLITSYFNKELMTAKMFSIAEFIVNLWNHIRGREELLDKHTNELWYLLVFVICLFTALNIYKGKKLIVLLCTYLYFLMFYWYIHINIAYPMLGLFLILYTVLVGVKGYFRAFKEDSDKKIRYLEEIYKKWIGSLLCYCIIAITIAVALPKYNYRMSFYWVENMVNQYFPVIARLRDDSGYGRDRGKGTLFNLTETGFQEGRSLGGPVKQSDRLVMRVKSPFQLYLRGNVKSIYDKNSWWSDNRSYITYLQSDDLPISVDFGTEALLEITYIDLATNTIFTPYQPVEVLLRRGGKLRANDDYHIIADKTHYKNDSYIVRALLPSEKALGINYSSSYIESKYLQLPSDLSPRIKGLADTITEGTVDPYEKAMIIRDYLRSNYHYSVDMPFVPMYKEFVENFLFEEKRGYCTYFATAMAVMLRTQGIPSRYVEGYRLPKEISDEGLYEVRQKNAHAWVEAYFPKLGWLTLEATPAYSTGIEVLVRGTGDSGSYFDEYEELQRLLENQNSSFYDTPVEGGLNEGNDPLAIGSNKGKLSVLDKLKKLTPIILQLIFFGFIPIRGLYLRMKLRSYRRRLAKVKANKAIVSIYNDIIQLLSLLEHPLLMGETPYEYSDRIKQYIYDNNNSFGDVTESFVLGKFSRYTNTEEERVLLLGFLDFIDNKVRNHLGFWRYYYLKYLKGGLYNGEI